MQLSAEHGADGSRNGNGTRTTGEVAAEVRGGLRRVPQYVAASLFVGFSGGFRTSEAVPQAVAELADRPDVVHRANGDLEV
jgi:hypothetical protein